MVIKTLDCPKCHHTNVAEAKFCESCGFDFFTPTPSPVPPAKKRSIFDDIEDEVEKIVEKNEEEEVEELDLNILQQAVEEEIPVPNIFEKIVETDVEVKPKNIFEKEEEEKEGIEEPGELELVFTKTPAEKEVVEEKEEETLEFIFEKTPAETEKPIINKADIPFEIVEPVAESADFFEEVIEEAAEEMREVEEEPITEESIFDKIIQEKEELEQVEIIEEEIQEVSFEGEDKEAIEAEEIEEFKLETPPPINDLFEENPNHSVEEEIFKKYAIAFEKQIKTEQNANKYNAYVDRFEESDFKLSFEFRVKQLAEEVQKIRQDQSILKDEASLLNQAFTELIDYFIIRYCEDLNQVQLSERILQYQNIAPESIDLSAMILDYLDFEKEDERVDFDFIKMPMKRLQNASKSFLFPEKGEKIFFICDQSILGSGKEGFAMTEKAIYWKMQFESAQRVYYKNMLSVEPQKDWININEMFFNTNPSLNVKMMKLLKKLKWVVNATS